MHPLHALLPGLHAVLLTEPRAPPRRALVAVPTTLILNENDLQCWTLVDGCSPPQTIFFALPYLLLHCSHPLLPVLLTPSDHLLACIASACTLPLPSVRVTIPVACVASWRMGEGACTSVALSLREKAVL